MGSILLMDLIFFVAILHGILFFATATDICVIEGSALALCWNDGPFLPTERQGRRESAGGRPRLQGKDDRRSSCSVRFHSCTDQLVLPHNSICVVRFHSRIVQLVLTIRSVTLVSNMRAGSKLNEENISPTNAACAIYSIITFLVSC